MISVALASFNGSRFILPQVESILEQLGADDELVVADNGSTDGTWEILTDLSKRDLRVKIFLNDQIKGVIQNFAYALQQCQGEIIFLADQDDLWYPTKVKAILDVFDRNSPVLLIQSDAELIDENGQLLEPSFFALRQSGPGVLKNFWRNTYQGCTLAFRKSLLAVALPFPAHLPMHDMWLGILAEWTGKVLFIPDRLTAYRRHAGNKSGLLPRETRQVIRWRVDLAIALISRLHKAVQIRQANRRSL